MTIGVVGIRQAMVALLFVEEPALAEPEPIERREPALFWLEAGVVGSMCASMERTEGEGERRCGAAHAVGEGDDRLLREIDRYFARCGSEVRGGGGRNRML